MATGTAEPASLELRIPANADRAYTLRRQLRAWLEEAGVSRDEAFEIVTAVSEAFINAVEHAQDPSSPQIDVTAEVVDNQVTLAVHDRGSWRADPRRPGGYGLLLMRTFMDDVKYNSTGNRCTMVKVRSAEQS